MQILEPNSPEEFSSYFEKRWEILRKPQGEPKGSEIDNMENISLHVMATDHGSVIGVGRLTYFNNGEGQIRFMGVDESFRNKKAGSKMLEYLETKAKVMGLKQLFLHARAEAVHFYKNNGYKVEGQSFKGYAGIEHFRMLKEL